MKVLEWVIRKRGMVEVLIGSVMSLCNGVRTRIRVGSEWSEEL